MAETKIKLKCDMTEGCVQAVTHIGDKGYTYCTDHGVMRRASGWERVRKMRAWEVRLLEAGEPLPSYAPGPKPTETKEG